jgi:hypothetical protein
MAIVVSKRASNIICVSFSLWKLDGRGERIIVGICMTVKPVYSMYATVSQ